MSDSKADTAEETADDDASTAERGPATDGPENAAVPGDTVGDALAGDGQSDGDDRADDGGRDLVAYVQWATFGILCLLALVATFRFYFAASEAIRVWFSRDFVPVFQAAFNLLVLLGSAVGISVLVRRLG